jgi:hypothetical protein
MQEFSVKKSVKLSLGSVLVAGALGAVLIPAAAASATTVDDCQSQLATLRADTVAAETSFTNQKSVDTEIGKLDAASTKLAEGDNADAVQKLVDFQTALNSLATASKAKVDAGTTQTLSGEAQGVIDCINAIGAETATA